MADPLFPDTMTEVLDLAAVIVFLLTTLSAALSALLIRRDNLFYLGFQLIGLSLALLVSHDWLYDLAFSAVLDSAKTYHELATAAFILSVAYTVDMGLKVIVWQGILVRNGRAAVPPLLVAVVRFQGPKANGMPELHRLTPPLAVLQERGFKVALVTDGRMSGASGKVPAAIHLTPEAVDGGPIAKIRDGDIIRLDADAGTLEVLADLSTRDAVKADLSANNVGTGRELFQAFRNIAGRADQGASIFEAV